MDTKLWSKRQKEKAKQADILTGGQKDRQTGVQTHRETEIPTNMQIDRLT